MAYVNDFGMTVKADQVIIVLGVSDLEGLAGAVLSNQIREREIYVDITHAERSDHLWIELNENTVEVADKLQEAGFSVFNATDDTERLMTMIFGRDVTYSWNHRNGTIEIKMDYDEYMKKSLAIL